MSLNISMKIEEALSKNFLLDDIKKQEILKFLLKYKVGHFLYASVLTRKFKLPPREVYLFLKELEKNEIVKSYYQIYCKTCDKKVHGLYETINEIPEIIECNECGEEISGIENSYVIYKVVKTDG